MNRNENLCKPSQDTIHEPALFPKDFQNSTNNQVVHVENRLVWSDGKDQTGNVIRNWRMDAIVEFVKKSYKSQIKKLQFKTN